MDLTKLDSLLVENPITEQELLDLEKRSLKPNFLSYIPQGKVDRPSSPWLSYTDPHPYKNRAGKSINRSTKVNPFLVNEVETQGARRGYPKHFPTALMGAETTFGTVGHGPSNPLSNAYPSREAASKAKSSSPEYKKVIQGYINRLGVGPWQEPLHFFDERVRNRSNPKITINDAFNTLDQKRELLKSRGIPITPENLAWYYQGTGTINKDEVPEGYAYGKPVKRTSPTTGHALLVKQIMDELVRKGGLQ